MRFDREAIGCTNELFYRDGAVAKDIPRQDAEYVKKTIERYLREAFEAGRASDLARQQGK